MGYNNTEKLFKMKKVLTIHKGNKADYKMYECNFEENLCKNYMTFF